MVTRSIQVFVILFILFLCVHGRIEKLNGRLVEEGDSISNKIVFLTADDSIIGSTDPSFSVNQSLSITNKENNTLQSNSFLISVFFSTSQSKKIGLLDENGVLQYCCSEDLFIADQCDDLGNVIIIPQQEGDTYDPKATLIIRNFLFKENLNSINWIENFKINQSGVYELLYLNCKGSKLGDVAISGSITYVNPFGQLSAESYPLLWFFGVITFVLIILGTVWSVFLLIHRNSLISLQKFISFLLILEFIEASTWFIMFWVTNRTGNLHWGWITMTVLTSSIKRTCVGLLYLLISLGYGIMNKARISNNTRLIIIVISFYFLVSTGQELINAFLREGVVSSDIEVFLSFFSLILLFPSVIIPLSLFWWICSCLSKTIQKVKLREQDAKIELYTKILISLIVACIVTLLMILMQTAISIIDSDEVWRVWWIFTAFWFTLFFGLTISLLVLFNPSKNEEWLAYNAKKRKNFSKDGDDDDFSSKMEIELDDLGKDIDISFDFDLGFDDIIEEETSKIS